LPQTRTSAPRGFVNPDFDQARGSTVAVLTQTPWASRYKRLFVIDQLGKHVLWLDVLDVRISTVVTPTLRHPAPR
jgi:hypothetical protein